MQNPILSKSTIPEKSLVVFPDLSIIPPKEAKVSAFDRSFHFGDSLYEVTRTYDGILFSLDEHMRRLIKSAKLAMYEVMPDTDHILEMIRKGCRAYFEQFGNHDVYVRVTLSRGVGDLNIDRSCSSEPYALVFVKELKAEPALSYTQGVHYALVSRRRNPPSALDPAMKSGNYLNNVLAMAEAKKMGAIDALMLSTQGFVTEGTTNNFYAVKNGEILTAPLSIGILAGITRDWIFEICSKGKFKISERLFTEAELLACEEMFFSSSTKEVVPITKLSGQPVGNGKPGPVTQALHKELKSLIHDYCKKHKGSSLYK